LKVISDRCNQTITISVVSNNELKKQLGVVWQI
jgi:hypothetical protein